MTMLTTKVCTSSLPFTPDPPCKQWQLRADQAHKLLPSSKCICIWSCVCICIYVFKHPGLPHNSAGPAVLQRLSRMLGEAWGSPHHPHREWDWDWELLRKKLAWQLLCSMWRGQGIHNVFFVHICSVSFSDPLLSFKGGWWGLRWEQSFLLQTSISPHHVQTHPGGAGISLKSW